MNYPYYSKNWPMIEFSIVYVSEKYFLTIKALQKEFKVSSSETQKSDEQ